MRFTRVGTQALRVSWIRWSRLVAHRQGRIALRNRSPHAKLALRSQSMRHHAPNAE